MNWLLALFCCGAPLSPNVQKRTYRPPVELQRRLPPPPPVCAPNFSDSTLRMCRVVLLCCFDLPQQGDGIFSEIFQALWHSAKTSLRCADEFIMVRSCVRESFCCLP